MRKLPEFKNASVLVVGDVMLDRYWHGQTSRISPEAPVPVVHVAEHEERAGGAANVAVNVASLGVKTNLVALTGNDSNADRLTRILEDHKVACHFFRDENLETITKLRVVSRHQQLIRLDFEQSFSQVDKSAFFQIYQKELANTDVVVFSDYGKGALSDVQKMIQLARDKKIAVLVDPKGSDFSRYKGATLITPNFSEFESIVGECRNQQEIFDKGEKLLMQLELDSLLVTRGENGMSLITRDGHAHHLPASAQEVFDVTGAGDTVIAVIASALAAGETIENAIVLSNHAAGMVVAKLGTASVTREELEQDILNSHRPKGIVTEEELIAMVNNARKNGNKIAMTNGCFDILHAGHVQYLQQASEFADRLIVAVNDDASVSRLKGDARPINTLQNRMQVLSAIGSVDWVVPFSSDTPEELICKIKPDFLIKGGDYKPEDVAGYQCVKDSGGEVSVLSFLDGASTSGLIEKIKGKETL